MRMIVFKNPGNKHLRIKKKYIYHLNAPPVITMESNVFVHKEREFVHI